MSDLTDEEMLEKAKAVSLTTEFHLCTQDRLDYSGRLILEMSDEQAGQWIKRLVREAVVSGLRDDRVTR